MMAKNDGGPAFPVPCNPDGAYVAHGGHFVDNGVAGMALRDWFAGQALIANRMAAPDAPSSEVAGMAFADADAMLAERE